MKILHLVNSQVPYLNDDEGSITHALRQLGHEVNALPEIKASKFINRIYDLTLFHHWYEGLDLIPKMPGIKVLWYFDCVNFAKLCPDVGTREEVRNRPKWLNQVKSICDLVFTTDGDWAEDNNSHWLTQGADQRIVYKAEAEKEFDVLYVGSTIPVTRQTFTRMLHRKYGSKLLHVNSIYRGDLAKIVSKTKVAVCPDSPVTDNYWSNRVYILTGFGSCVFHPECKRLHDHFAEDELVFYSDREELLEKIDKCLEDESYERRSYKSWNRTRIQHTYLHRCMDLMKVVDNVFKLKEQ